MRKVWNYRGTAIIIFLAVFGYELLTDITKRLDPLLFPGLSKILPALWEQFGNLNMSLLSSLKLLVPAYSLALVLGVLIGLIVGWSEPLRRNLTPIFRGLSPIPPTMYIPYTIAVLPTFWSASVFIILLGCFWPILTGTIHGVAIIEQRHIDNARMLNLKGIKFLRKVVLPAATPSIFSGAGISLVFAFILLMVAEMFGSTSGLGYFIQQQADFSEYAKVLAGLLYMSVFIILVMVIFDLIQRRALHWLDKR
jgi:NitT/TauT family transport system permease protein